MKPPKQTKIWTTREGERIRICDMTDTHLTNTINMLVRKAPDAYSAALQIAMAFDSTFERAHENGHTDALCEHTDLSFLQETVPVFENLLWDFSRRNLSADLLSRSKEVFEQCYLALYNTDKY